MLEILIAEAVPRPGPGGGGERPSGCEKELGTLYKLGPPASLLAAAVAEPQGPPSGSGVVSQPGFKPCVLCIGRWVLIYWSMGEVPKVAYLELKPALGSQL